MSPELFGRNPHMCNYRLQIPPFLPSERPTVFLRKCQQQDFLQGLNTNTGRLFMGAYERADAEGGAELGQLVGLSVLVCNEGLDPSVCLAFHMNVAFHERISTSSTDLERFKRQKRGAPSWLSRLSV